MRPSPLWLLVICDRKHVMQKRQQDCRLSWRRDNRHFMRFIPASKRNNRFTSSTIDCEEQTWRPFCNSLQSVTLWWNTMLGVAIQRRWSQAAAGCRRSDALWQVTRTWALHFLALGHKIRCCQSYQQVCTRMLAIEILPRFAVIIAACSARFPVLYFRNVQYSVNDILTRRIAGSVLFVVYLFATCLSLFNIITHIILTLL